MSTKKIVFLARFKRNELMAPEYGVAVGSHSGDVDTIIDQHGKVVGDVWNYVRIDHVGFMWFDIPDTGAGPLGSIADQLKDAGR